MVEVPQWFASGWRVKISAGISTPVYAGMPIAVAVTATESLEACEALGIA